MNRGEIKKNPLKSEPQSLALKNIKLVKRFRFQRLFALFHFATIHLREVSQIFDNSFTRGQPPISVTGHWRILSCACKEYGPPFRIRSHCGFVVLGKPRECSQTSSGPPQHFQVEVRATWNRILFHVGCKYIQRQRFITLNLEGTGAVIGTGTNVPRAQALVLFCPYI